MFETLGAPLLSGGSGGLGFSSSAESRTDPVSNLISPKIFNLGGGISTSQIALMGGIALVGIYLWRKDR